MTNTVHGTQRINPSTWNLALGYDQAQLRPAPARLLTLAGQGALSVDGVPSDGDMAQQLGQALDNVVELLHAGGMDLTDVVSMTIHVTDMDAAMGAWSVVTDRLGMAGATPPGTIVEVRRLALPQMLVEITVSAAR